MTNRNNQGVKFTTDASESATNSYQTTDDDVSKWEKMYYSAESTSQTQFNFQSTDDDEDPLREPTTSDIRIITFDLDNTLWKTGPTISYANKMLNEHLQSLGVADDKLVEVEMGRLFEANKRKYAGGNFIEDDVDISRQKKNEELASEVMNVGETKEDDDVIGGNVVDDLVHIRAESKKKKIQPVYLTMLRKDAICSLLQSTSTVDANLLKDEVENAFQLWMSARTESITQNYADNVLVALSKIRSSIVPSSTTGKLYIGAITDGNSDPKSVPSIGEYFDFVVKAEDVGVSKPDERVYKAAIAELLVSLVRDGYSVENFFLGESTEDPLGYGSAAYIEPFAKTWKDVDEETVDAFAEAVGPWWVHVGDDFFKDVVASKGFRMRSIWVRELIAEKHSESATEPETPKVKRTLEELEEELAKQNGVLKMAIGESEFLATTLHEEFSDAILEKFEEIGDLLIDWHDEGLKAQTSSPEMTMKSMNSETESVDTGMTETNAQEVTALLQQRSTIDRDETADKKRFCVFCGEKLPSVAKFCSVCGEKQP
jgi:FMN phosphatase YigB (HAD superfamily)